MQVTDYIVDFIIKKGITDVFGYPGGSISYFVDALHKREEVHAHVVYHEQAAAFAAAAYAEISMKPGIAYSTGGPGATNLITGIGHAYYDSIPVIMLTGNVNTYERKGSMGIRQRGFQESDIISVVAPLTKYCAYVESADKIRFYLEKAYSIAMKGRRGPVLLDLPMDVLRMQINPEELEGYTDEQDHQDSLKEAYGNRLAELLNESERPCVVLGNAVKLYDLKEQAISAVAKLKVPCLTSMIAFDVFGENPLCYGFLGAYGMRAANFIAAKSDLVISIGSRMDIRQIGVKRENFAPNARILRIDIDEGELCYKVHEAEESFCMDAKEALEALNEVNAAKDFSQWLSVCDTIRSELENYDHQLPNEYIRKLSALIPENTIITTDVGQNQVWVAQSFQLKNKQTVLFSGGMGAMGHALPSAIGAYYGTNDKKKVFCICGDGGMQMNIQELQFLAREKIPVKIIVFNNHSLGMIRHFQEMYLGARFHETTEVGGYTAPDFAKVAEAYGIPSISIDQLDMTEQSEEMLISDGPALIEIKIFENTYVVPKLEFGKPNQDQEPLIDRDLYERLMNLN
ncbi:MAG: thiamine pyrophosphate-binding protein [Lachnospiraceae bacterium]|nr:thiamine pyrophosphate-binding protein [Lachnospiraceae bacterium]